LEKLDVGCGRSKKGNIGLDIRSLPGIDVRADAHNLPFQNEVFDAVVSTVVFEHSFNQLNFLKEQYRVLKIGGRIEVTTDNAQYYCWSVMKFREIRHQDYHEDHYTIFFPEGVVRLMRLAGFQNISYSYLRWPRKLDVLALLLIKIRFWREECLFPRFKVVGSKIG